MRAHLLIIPFVTAVVDIGEKSINHSSPDRREQIEFDSRGRGTLSTGLAESTMTGVDILLHINLSHVVRPIIDRTAFN